MASHELEDGDIKAEIDEIMQSVNQVMQNLEKHGLLKKESKEKPEPEEGLSTDAGAGAAAE